MSTLRIMISNDEENVIQYYTPTPKIIFRLKESTICSSVSYLFSHMFSDTPSLKTNHFGKIPNSLSDFDRILFNLTTTT